MKDAEDELGGHILEEVRKTVADRSLLGAVGRRSLEVEEGHRGDLEEGTGVDFQMPKADGEDGRSGWRSSVVLGRLGRLEDDSGDPLRLDRGVGPFGLFHRDSCVGGRLSWRGSGRPGTSAGASRLLRQRRMTVGKWKSPRGWPFRRNAVACALK